MYSSILKRASVNTANRPWLRHVLELGTMVRKSGNIGMEYAAIYQLLYVHCTGRIDDVFAHLRLGRMDGTIVEYYTSPIKGIAESQRVKEVCDYGGHVRTVLVLFLKVHPGRLGMRYQTDGWRPRERKQGCNDEAVGTGGARDNHSGHGLLRRMPER